MINFYCVKKVQYKKYNCIESQNRQESDSQFIQESLSIEIGHFLSPTGSCHQSQLITRAAKDINFEKIRV